MSLGMILLYLLSGIGLYFLLNYVDKKYRDNYINGAVISIIYIIILAGIFSNYNLVSNNDNIFLIIVIEFFIRLFIDCYIKEIPFFREGSINKKKYIISILGGYIINYYFINRVSNVFLEGNDLKIIIWGLIILYLYFMFKNDFGKYKFRENKFYFYRDREYVVMQYAKFKNKYFRVVRTKYRELIPVIYSIMIYENYNKGEVIRKLDNLKYKISKNRGKFGIMQVYSNYFISDDKSIVIAIRKLEKLYVSDGSRKINYKSVLRLLNKYYKSSVDNKKIGNIYKIIVSFDKM